MEIVNVILYKLKSGCQWRLLPIGHLFCGEDPTWNTVFHHYRKWSVKEELQTIFSRILNRDKSCLVLSVSHIDGSHTPGYRGGEKALRSALGSYGIIPNVCPNPKNGEETTEEWLYDEEMYKERWKIERTNAWMESFKAVLTRFDTTIASWKGWNFLAFIVIFLKKFHKSN